MIFVSSDHGGWRMKQHVVRYLRSRGYAVTDLGPIKPHPGDDYPVWAQTLAQAVRRTPGSFGIGLCRSGVGMAMVANKVPGIRATQAFSAAMAKQARRDEDTNVLSLAADYQSWPTVQSIVRIWLSTDYRPLKRYQRRLTQIKRIERHGR